MIVYQGNKADFSEHVILNNIDNVIHDFYKKNMGRSTSQSEITSWRNSMQYMNNVLLDPEIPNDSGVVIEYQVPQTSKRIDFILTGQDQNQKNYAILIELKQWDKALLTEKDAVVSTFVGGKVREVSHPSHLTKHGLTHRFCMDSMKLYIRTIFNWFRAPIYTIIRMTRLSIMNSMHRILKGLLCF
jgi:hypothetical protein